MAGKKLINSDDVDDLASAMIRMVEDLREELKASQAEAEDLRCDLETACDDLKSAEARIAELEA